MSKSVREHVSASEEAIMDEEDARWSSEPLVDGRHVELRKIAPRQALKAARGAKVEHLDTRRPAGLGKTPVFLVDPRELSRQRMLARLREEMVIGEIDADHSDPLRPHMGCQADRRV